MRKHGFTLAEILITLGIIGVVAAITLPGLNSNVNSRKIGPALAKAVNTLENANHTALMEESENILIDLAQTYTNCEDGDICDDGGTDPNSYLNRLARYLSGDLLNRRNFLSKDGILYYMQDVNSVASPKFSDDGDGVLPNQKYYGKYFKVLIDANGYKKPNAGGKDRFLVYVDFYGTVIPAGSQEAVDYGVESRATICKAGGTVSEKCTGTIADAGWEMRF